MGLLTTRAGVHCLSGNAARSVRGGSSCFNWRSIDSRQSTSSGGASRSQSYATSETMRVICTADEDLRPRLQELTAGKGIERAIDCVARDLGAEIARNLAPAGTMLVYGAFPVIGRPSPRNSSCRSLLFG